MTSLITSSICIHNAWQCIFIAGHSLSPCFVLRTYKIPLFHSWSKVWAWPWAARCAAAWHRWHDMITRCVWTWHAQDLVGMFICQSDRKVLLYLLCLACYMWYLVGYLRWVCILRTNMDPSGRGKGGGQTNACGWCLTHRNPLLHVLGCLQLMIPMLLPPHLPMGELLA